MENDKNANLIPGVENPQTTIKHFLEKNKWKAFLLLGLLITSWYSMMLKRKLQAFGLWVFKQLAIAMDQYGLPIQIILRSEGNLKCFCGHFGCQIYFNFFANLKVAHLKHF